MKKSINRYLIVGLAAFAFACDNEEVVTYSESNAQEQVVADPFLQVQTPVVGFQAGTDSYEVGVNIINGTKAIEEVNVYSTFTDAATGESSNEVLLTTLAVDGPTRTVVTDELTYDELKAGLTVGGNPLPEDQFELAVGSGWALRFEGVTPSGEVIPLAGSIDVAVLSPYAGIYEYESMVYYRIGVLRNDVTDPEIGEDVFIGSVDEDTFAQNGWWGPFPWTGAHFEFDVDFENPISEGVYPVINFAFPDGIYSGNRALVCASDAADLSHANCPTSDRLIVDLETGAHELRLSYGYFVDGSGAREFYTVLKKVTE